MLRKGSKVNVYHDPVTETEVEGKAILVRFLLDNGEWGTGRLEHWQVIFSCDEGEIRQRWIKNKKATE